jgi:hypothetical protein
MSDSAMLTDDSEMPSSLPETAQQERKVGLLLWAGVLVLPFLFAWFLLRQGHRNRDRLIAFVWLVIFFSVQGSKVDTDAAINSAAAERAGSESTTLNVGELQKAGQAMIDLERNHPWSTRISGRMAEGAAGNHCMSVLRAVAAYEKGRLPVPPELIVSARKMGCL